MTNNIEARENSQVEEFRLLTFKFEDKKNRSEHPWTQDNVLWKLVADDLFTEAESLNGKDKERRALLYHQAAHIYMATDHQDLAGRSYKRLIEEGLEVPFYSN